MINYDLILIRLKKLILSFLCLISFSGNTLKAQNTSLPIFDSDVTYLLFGRAISQNLLNNHYAELSAMCFQAKFFIHFEFDSDRNIVNITYPYFSNQTDSLCITWIGEAIQNTRNEWFVPDEYIGVGFYLWVEVKLLSCSTQNMINLSDQIQIIPVVNLYSYQIDNLLNEYNASIGLEGTTHKYIYKSISSDLSHKAFIRYEQKRKDFFFFVGNCYISF